MKYPGSEEYQELAFYTLAHPDMEYFAWAAFRNSHHTIRATVKTTAGI